MVLNQDRLNLYLSIDWFQNVAQEFKKDYKIEIKRVKSWKEAIKYNQSVYYGNRLLDEFNGLRKMFYTQREVEKGTDWILDADKEWGVYTTEIYDFLKGELLPKIKESKPNVQEKRILYILFLEYMENIVIGNKESNCLRELFELLKDGYYPCGWNQTTKQFYVY